MPVKTKFPVRRARPNGRRAPAARRPAATQTRVAIIGAGAGGSALLTILARDPLVRIVGIAESMPRPLASSWRNASASRSSGTTTICWNPRSLI